MHDIKTIRDNPAAFDSALARRGLPAMAARLIELDEARRKHITALQDMQARRNAASKEIGAAKKAKDDAKASALMAEVAELKDKLSAGEAEERRLQSELDEKLALIPNLPRADVPDGKDEHDNKEVRKVGTPKAFDFKPKQHFELGEALGLMDFESAAKVSGARFVFLKGALARLERALAQFMLDLHTGPAKDGLGGYMEVNPPILVGRQAAFGTGNLPKFEVDLFETYGDVRKLQQEISVLVQERSRQSANTQKRVQWYEQVSNIQLKLERLRKKLGDAAFLDDLDKATALLVGDLVRDADAAHLESTELMRKLSLAVERTEALGDSPSGRLFLIPTAEVSLTNLVREQILDEAKLPMRFTACTPCFRSEAGAAGRDTRGMIRQHQFTKVELVSITTPEASLAEHERMTACAEEVLKRLGLPFRTMLLCTGDMGFASQKTYDIEVWLPGQDAYREISSCSVCGDFQARRMGARYRPKDAKGTEFVHTLNGSGLAVGRTLIAVMENYQEADGSIRIPDALKPYMGGMEVIGSRG